MVYLISIFIAWLLIKLEIFKPPRNQLACGIFGFSGSRPVDLTKLRWLAAENQIRGIDSTGVFGNHLFKEKGPAKVVMLMPGFVAATKGAHTIQGHTRSASAGFAVTKENAHPFHYGYKDTNDDEKWSAEVVGAHNGFIIPEMLRYHEESLGFKKYFSVDSQLIFAALAKTGDVNTISQLEGGMAISFQILSHNPNRLYLYKREQTRPLFIGEASDGLYYSSLEDSLQYIGCRSTWELNPNQLYTLEGGEIIDVYKMPSPVLKSLAANVTRASWRAGVPHAELNALPVNVISPMKLIASGNDNKQSKFKNMGNARGFSQNNETVAARMAGEYKGKSSIDTKFNMLINNISDELKKLDAFPIDPSVVISSEENHMSSCALAIHVVNGTNNKGLVAWSILADGDRELAGLTSANGITLIKIPQPKCDQDIKFMAYSPVEEYGPYEFIIRPEAARVMEVTLSIPFLKKGGKKEAPTNTIDEHVVDETGCGSGQTSCDISLSPFKSTAVHGYDKSNDSGILRDDAPQISWGCSKEQIDRLQAGADATDIVIPETDLDIPLGNGLEERIKSTIVRLKGEALDITVDVALESTSGGKYKNFPKLPFKLTAWAAALPDRAIMLQHYTTNFYSVIRTSELIIDASRLVQRDRYVSGVWFPFWIYIELLLKHKFQDYIRPSMDVKKLNVTDYLPSTVLKKSLPILSPSGPGREKNVHPCLVYMAFLNYLVTTEQSSNMDDIQRTIAIKQLNNHKNLVAESITNLNQLLLDDDKNFNLTTDQLQVIRETRNLLKLEYGDITDFLKKLELENIAAASSSR